MNRLTAVIATAFDDFPESVRSAVDARLRRAQELAEETRATRAPGDEWEDTSVAERILYWLDAPDDTVREAYRVSAGVAPTHSTGAATVVELRITLLRRVIEAHYTRRK
jgi:hypothetical protein